MKTLVEVDKGHQMLSSMLKDNKEHMKEDGKCSILFCLDYSLIYSYVIIDEVRDGFY